MTEQNTNIWFNDPTVLLKKNQINKFWPTKNMSSNEKVNAITRLVIILTILGFIVTQSYNFFFTGLITLGIIIILYYTKEYKENEKSNVKTEGFTNSKVYEAVKDNFTNPTNENPFMNVMIPEINDNPKRKMAAPAYNPAVEKKINKDTQDFIVSNFDNDPDIKNKLFSSLGDSFEFENFGQYNFYSTANTQVSNDQKSFAEFCYGGMVSGKEGNDFALLQNNPRIGGIAGQN
tara:strand:- start:1623 stop:2321 length:699 start_codon:yes stop_codon:yes gene_type:complete